jgi:hypothetical protein
MLSANTKRTKLCGEIEADFNKSNTTVFHIAWYFSKLFECGGNENK